MSDLVNELRERHAPNVHQYSNDDSDLAEAGDAILDAADRIAALEALLREGRGQSYGVMGIGTHKLIALNEWFAKVDAALGPILERSAKDSP